MFIRFVTTGGTIDKIYFDALSQFEVGDSPIETILTDGLVAFDFDVVSLFRKDSLEMTDEDRALTLHVGSDDAFRLWVDGELIGRSDAGRGVAPDQDSVRVTVPPGQHDLLFKVVNYGGAHGFAFALLALQSAVFFGHSAYRLYLDPWAIVLASGLLAIRAKGEG